MKFRYTVEELEALDIRQFEVKKRVRLGGMSIQDALDETQAMLDKTRKPKAQQVLDLHSYPIWWVSCREQIAKVKDFMELNGCCAPIPAFPLDFEPQTPTEVPLLAVYLSDRLGIGGIQRTFDAWWKFIEAPKGFDKYTWEGFSSDAEHLKLIPDETKPDKIRKQHSGARWVGFDPNANRGISVRSCWEKASNNTLLQLTGSEVLMAAKLFPDWVSMLGTGDCPNPNMAGYQFKIIKPSVLGSMQSSKIASGSVS